MHQDFLKAIEHLAAARSLFEKLAAGGAILGNDNHIGDIGEYWARRHFELTGQFNRFGDKKTSPFDIELIDGSKVSVKTITEWSKTKKGTQIKPLDGESWQLLMCVALDPQLRPERMALVPFRALATRPEFAQNARRRNDLEAPTTTFPVFRWWPWLAEHQLPLDQIIDAQR